MGLFNKLAIPLVVSIGLSASAMAAEYKVGDRMPSFSGEQLAGYGPKYWESEDGTVRGDHVPHTLNDSGEIGVFLTRVDCGNKGMLVFAAYDYASGTLAFDNDPNDGEIDEVVHWEEGRRSPEDDAPACPVDYFKMPPV